MDDESVFSAHDYELPYDDADHEHDWQPVWSTNAAGRAYQCQICWDRTD